MQDEVNEIQSPNFEMDSIMPCSAKSSFKTGFTDLPQEINHINSVLPKTGFSRVKLEIRKSLLSEFELSTAPHTHTQFSRNLYSIKCRVLYTCSSKMYNLCPIYPFLHQSYRRPRRNAVQYKEKTNKQS
jgi:hypothetical protein